MISFEIDSFIEDRDETIWFALLSDGRTVYQDDGRPELAEFSAWKRLKKFCEENHLFVKKVYIKFRSHTESMPESSDGYFFRYGAMGSPADDKLYKYYICGPIINSQIHVTKWRIPEIIVESTEVRDLEGNEDGIICSQEFRKKTSDQTNI